MCKVMTRYLARNGEVTFASISENAFDDLPAGPDGGAEWEDIA